MNMLHGYEVLYTAQGTVMFKVVYMSTIFGGDELPAGSAAAEIKLTPDNKFLIISFRMDELNPPSALNRASPSDTLVTFSLDPKTGTPKLLQKFSAGGVGPRSFAINRAGDRVAVALKAQNKLVILKRDIKTGSFSGQLGSFDLDVGGAAGLVSSVVWAEDGGEDIVVAGGGGGGGGGSTSAVSAPTPSSSAKGSSLPSTSSEESTLTTATTVLATATFTQYDNQATGSGSQNPAPSPPTLTRTVVPLPKTSAANTNPAPISLSSAGSDAGKATNQTSQLTSSHSEIAGTSPTAAPPAANSPSINSKPGYFATMEPGSGSPPNTNTNPDPTPAPSPTSNGGDGFPQRTTSFTGTPSPLQTDMVMSGGHFYEVVKGNTCDDICKNLGVPSKSFGEWNPSVGAECKGLIAGEWVCVGL
ncbi:hypothetical protein IFR05_010931 [Cadophora sp. M221]|nr:hypothetical protein IFR05_010931 [Cadophora sp. M221]